MTRKTKGETDTPETRDRNEAEGQSPEERIVELERRCEDLNTQWLRAQADYKNLRRRALTDSEAALRREMQPLLEELLLALDFLDMALSSPVESRDAENLLLGVQMTRTKFVQALEGAQLEPIPTDGLFDPAVHEASETRADTDAAPGSIVETVRRGYTWRGQVLRPAVVVVAAGEDRDDPAAKATGETEPTGTGEAEA